MADTVAMGVIGDLVGNPVMLPLLLFDRPTVDLIGAMETQSEPSELELDDVVITNPHIEAILENEDWIEDASYVLHAWFHPSVSQTKLIL